MKISVVVEVSMDDAYLKQGKDLAKQEIINLIQGEKE